MSGSTSARLGYTMCYTAMQANQWESFWAGSPPGESQHLLYSSAVWSDAADGFYLYGGEGGRPEPRQSFQLWSKLASPC